MSGRVSARPVVQRRQLWRRRRPGCGASSSAIVWLAWPVVIWAAGYWVPACAQDPGAVGAGPDGLGLLRGPAGWERPIALHVWPDSLGFGDRLWVAVDFPATGGRLVADSLRSETAWLLAESGAAARRRSGVAGWLDRLRARSRREGERGRPPRDVWPRARGERVVGAFRVYHTGSLRVGWREASDLISAEVHAGTLLAGGRTPAGVRDPRSLGWRWERLASIGAAVVVGLWLAWRGRRRQRCQLRPRHAELAAPAYLETAIALLRLREEQLPERGEGRLFLDRLSRRLREFVSAQFLVPAVDLTPVEIASRLVALGHRRQAARRLADLLAECDVLRYAPDAVAAGRCDDLLSRAVRSIDELRVPARFTPVPPALAVTGEQAWARLRQAVAGLEPIREGGRV